MILARATLRADGTGTVVLDGETHPVAGADVAAARQQASTLLLQHAHAHGVVVRAAVSEPDGAWTIDVTPDGTITDATEEPDPEAEGEVDAAEVPTGSRREPSGEEEPVESSLRGRLFGPAASETPSEPAPAARPKRRIAPPGRAVGAAALALVLAGGAAVAALAVDGEAKDSPPTTTKAPVQPAPGWSATPAWVSPKLAETSEGRSPFLVTDETITTATKAGEGATLTALNARDGESLWTRDLKEPLTATPYTTTYDDDDAIAAATAHSLTIWPQDKAAGPAPEKTWTFTEAAVKPVLDSPMPLLANPATATALALKDDKLVRRTLPGGSTPVAALEDGVVIAVTDSAHWWALQSPTKRPQAQMLQPPAWGAQPQKVLGLAGDTLIVSWTRSDHTRFVAGYDVRKGMRPTWQTTVSDDPEPDTMKVSPDESWAIVGATALDTANGRHRSLPSGWKTLRITNEAAWSKDHVSRKLQRAVETPRPTTERAGIPAAVTKDGYGLIAADGRLFALEEDPEREYDDGQTVAPPPSPSSTETKKPAKKKTTPSEKRKKDSPSKKKSPSKTKGEK